MIPRRVLERQAGTVLSRFCVSTNTIAQNIWQLLKLMFYMKKWGKRSRPIFSLSCLNVPHPFPHATLWNPFSFPPDAPPSASHHKKNSSEKLSSPQGLTRRADTPPRWPQLTTPSAPPRPASAVPGSQTGTILATDPIGDLLPQGFSTRTTRIREEGIFYCLVQVRKLRFYVVLLMGLCKLWN